MILNFYILIVICSTVYSKHNLTELKYEVKSMFEFAFRNYMQFAYPYDELRPITCDGHDTWGGFGLTLIDSLDTLVVMGLNEEFQKAVKLVLKNTNVDRDMNVSVFETNIRVVGGLLSAHLLSKQGGIDPLEPGWPCNGPLLRMSESVARKLLPAFNSATGMPYGTVNLKYGVPQNETPITCTAGVGTFILEFGALSKLTGDDVFEKVAMRALKALWNHRSSIDLVGNHIDVQTGKWTALESGIGSGIDSYFEYLAKGSILFKNKELRYMFDEYLKSIEKYIRHDDWHFMVKMDKGSSTQPFFQSLEAFWPGVLSLTGDLDRAIRTLHNYHQVWKSYGAIPEFYNIAKSEPVYPRNAYPLRPELIESIMYIYRANRDPNILQMAVDILRSIQINSRTSCGFATVHSVQKLELENRMESFLLSETLKYLYLTFDDDNFLHASNMHNHHHQYRHSRHQGYTPVTTLSGGQCLNRQSNVVFNTEAHPIDGSALYCCSEYHNDLAQIDNMHSQYPLLRLLNITEFELNLANLPTEQLKYLETHRHDDRDTNKNFDWVNLDQSTKISKLDLSSTVLGCPNTRFNYQFLVNGQVFPLPNLDGSSVDKEPI